MSDDDHDPLIPLVARLLKELGEDPGRNGLERTPQRVAKSLRFLTQGYEQNPTEILNNALFDVSYDEMVIVKDIDVYSMCEHHMLPFFGRAHVAYIPNGKVVGLSKVPRLVEMFSRRLQVQERLTMDIAETLERVLHRLPALARSHGSSCRPTSQTRWRPGRVRSQRLEIRRSTPDRIG